MLINTFYSIYYQIKNNLHFSKSFYVSIIFYIIFFSKLSIIKLKITTKFDINKKLIIIKFIWLVFS